MSELKTNKVSPFEGTNLTLGDSGDTITIPAGAILAGDGSGLTGISGGVVVQVVNTQTGAVATSTAIIPNDNTIPQISEGGLYLTRAITPTNSSNKLLINVVMNMAGGSGTTLQVALFQDSTANALACQQEQYSDPNCMQNISFSHYMAAGTTSSTSFTVRMGTSGATTTTLNGASGSRNGGGVNISSITITEILA